jgi:hypothetical protein
VTPSLVHDAWNTAGLTPLPVASAAPGTGTKAVTFPRLSAGPRLVWEVAVVPGTVVVVVGTVVDVDSTVVEVVVDEVVEVEAVVVDAGTVVDVLDPPEGFGVYVTVTTTGAPSQCPAVNGAVAYWPLPVTSTDLPASCEVGLTAM